MAGSSVASTTKTPGTSAPSRSARRRTWLADSSAATSRQRLPRAPIEASAWSSNVDFPVPGSPPSSVAEPGKKPPARTLSSSPIPVDMGLWEPRSTSASATGTRGAMPPRPRGPIEPEPGPETEPANPLRAGQSLTTTSSCNEFHSPQAVHRPTQRAWEAPQPWQRCTVPTLFIAAVP